MCFLIPGTTDFEAFHVNQKVAKITMEDYNSDQNLPKSAVDVRYVTACV